MVTKSTLFCVLVFFSIGYSHAETKKDIEVTLSRTQNLQNFTPAERATLLGKIHTHHETIQGERFFLKINNNETVCREFSVNFFGASDHPGGNRNGQLNERNTGYGITCYLEKNRRSFVSINGLTNSQFGSTLTVGYGKNFNVLSWNNFHIDGGITGAFVSYERRDSKTSYGILPLPFVRISYDLPKNMGRISLTRHYIGSVTLQSMETVGVHLTIPF